jgi:hypothetical protein
MRKILFWAFIILPGLLLFNHYSNAEVPRADSRESLTIKLQYIDEEKESQKYLRLAIKPQSGTFSKKAVGKLANEPNYISQEPLYASLRLGKEKTLITVILDKSDITIKDYDIIWVDVNSNKDFSDDKPISLINSDVKNAQIAASNAYFTIPVKYEDGKIYSRKIKFMIMKQNGVISFYARINSCYKGDIKIDDENYQIILYDGNANAIYNDLNEDKIKIWVKGENPLKINDVKLSSVINLRNKLYSLEPSEPGQEIKLTPYSQPMGQFKINLNFVSFTGKIDSLILDSTKGNIIVKDLNTSELKLPPDSYSIPEGTISLTDKNKHTYQLNFKHNNKALVVKNDEITTVKLGQTLKMVIKLVNKNFIRGGKIIVNGDIIGTDGELWTFLAGEKMEKRFKVIVKDKNGDLVKDVNPNHG